jgi:Mg2+/Co2+ transporter CorC
VPKRGDTLTVQGLRIHVRNADSRRVHMLVVEKVN